MSNDKKRVTKAMPLSMIFADKIFKEEGTKKINIIGMFRCIFSRKFPAMYGKEMFIYQSFTDVTGELEQTGCLEARYIDRDNEKIMQMFIPIKISPDRLGFTETIFGFEMFPLLRPGKIEFIFYLNNSYINTGTLEILQIENLQKGV